MTVNYLAHLYLADDDPEFLVGSLLGDFLKGPLDERLAGGLRQGVLIHRKIDVYTDAHPLFRRSKQRLRPQFRRYGGILIDIYYDHFLAGNWSRYSPLSLRDFSGQVYRILEVYYPDLPPSMQRMVSGMIANDLLMSYRELDGIGRALQRIEHRLKRRESRLGDAVEDLALNYTELRTDFEAFFPQLIAYVAQLKTTMNRPFQG